MFRSTLGLLGILFLVAANPARGGGFFFSDPGPQAIGRAGAFTAAADDATAIEINPGALGKLAGTCLQFDVAMLWATQSFARQGPYASVGGHGAWRGWPPAGWIPRFWAASDFGLRNVVLAFAIHAPNAIANLRFPATSPQKYALERLDLTLLTYTLAGAWRVSPDLSFGLALHWFHLPRAHLGMVVDGYWLSTTHEDAGPYDALALVKVSDPFAFSATLGVWWRARTWLELGAAVRLVPLWLHAAGRFSLDFQGATISRMYETGLAGGNYGLVLTDNRIRLDVTLPLWARVGIRFVGRTAPLVKVHPVWPVDPNSKSPSSPSEAITTERWDAELDLVYEAWSLLREYRLQFAGAFRLIGADGQLPLHALHLTRNLQDSIAVRLGGSWRPVEDLLTIRAGFFYESPTVPLATTSVDIAGSHRFGLSAGASLQWGPIAFDASYLHVFMLERQVAQGQSQIYQQRPASAATPLGPAVGAGKYRSSLDLLALGIRSMF